MKKTLVTLALYLVFLTTYAQSTDSTQTGSKPNSKSTTEVQTLLGSKSHFGFFVAPVIKGGLIMDEAALLPGLRLGWTINRVVSLGFEGYGLAPTITRDDILDNQKVRPLMGYGGFFIEPIIGSKKLIHITTPVMIGAGWIGHIRDWNDEHNEPYRDDLIDDQVVWVVEPGINAELNIANFFRVNLGISYRFMSESSLVNTPTKSFEGLNYSLTLKFGRF